CLIDSSTATTVTSASRTNVTVTGMRCQSEWAAKNVENRIAIAAASSAFVVTAYFRAELRSQTTSSVIATSTPIATRIGGSSPPWSTEYLRKKIAASTRAIPAIAENSFTPTTLSQSNGCSTAGGCGGMGGIGGRSTAGGRCGVAGGGGAAACST